MNCYLFKTDINSVILQKKNPILTFTWRTSCEPYIQKTRPSYYADVLALCRKTVKKIIRK